MRPGVISQFWCASSGDLTAQPALFASLLSSGDMAAQPSLCAFTSSALASAGGLLHWL